MKKLAILYRGPLESCNYACPYCPFAKTHDDSVAHEIDRLALERFINWVKAREHDYRISVFFTPWGEALIHRRYQRAFVTLSNLAHVDKVTIQTNLSCRLDWAEDCDKSRIALWTTYHPEEVPREQFLEKVYEARERNINLSVGIVGMQAHLKEIEMMRSILPDDIYLWVNAYKRVQDYYTDTQLDTLKAIDPLFPFNNVSHPSFGKACQTGEEVISVDGKGTMRRCHFVRKPIGNIYDADWEQALKPRTCSNQNCRCHIGYVHMPHLGLDTTFQEGILERIPETYRISKTP